MAEAMLRAHLAKRGMKARVRSAGAGRLPAGQPATDDAIAELAGRGLDLSKHRSHVLNQSAIAGADLILCMTRDHLRAVADLDPGALDRAFTLKDLVRRANARAPGQSFADWVRLLAESRSSSDVLGIGEDGIDDPIGQGPVAYGRCADELDALLGELASKLASGP
jgi:protein-tyrosine phosphatase